LAKSPIDWPYSSFHRHVKQGTYDSYWGAITEIKFDENVEHK
jgi:putative transposase